MEYGLVLCFDGGCVGKDEYCVKLVDFVIGLEQQQDVCIFGNEFVVDFGCWLFFNFGENYYVFLYIFMFYFFESKRCGLIC